jgi:hypothetical protein
VLQINLANLLAVETNKGNKRLVITTPNGDIGLRINDIVNVDAAGNADLPVLHLTELLPWTQHQHVDLEKQDIKPRIETSNEVVSDSLKVLVVRSQNCSLALNADNIDHIQELFAVQKETLKQTHSDTLIRIKNSLLSTRSLARLGANEPSELCNEHIAIIIQSEVEQWALLVEEVIHFEHVTQVYVSGSEGQNLQILKTATEMRDLLNAQPPARLWYISEQGQIRELVNANALSKTQRQALNVNLIEPNSVESASISPVYTSLENQGLQIYCGDNSYLLALALVKRTVNGLKVASRTRQRFSIANASQRDSQIPLINATPLLSARICLQKNRCILLLMLPNKTEILLSINKAALCLPTDKWRALHLPYPAALLFDAASYDEQQQRWILRLNNAFTFNGLPYSLKKAIRNSIIGWFDKQSIEKLL